MTAVFLALCMLMCTTIITVSATEDLTSDSVSFPLNTETVDCSNAMGGGQCTSTQIGMYVGNYVEYTVNTEKTGRYILSVYSSCGKNGMLFDVSVNGTTQLKNAVFPNITGAYNILADQVLGEITLAPGENVIRFFMPYASSDAAIMQSFTLSKKTEDITGDVVTFPLNIGTVDCSNAMGGQCTSDYIGLYYEDFVEYTIHTETAADYTISVNSGCSKARVLLDVAVNGTKQLEKAEFPVISGSYTAWADQTLGRIELKPGKNVIRFFMPYASSDAALIRSFTLKKSTENYIVDFAVENADGGRMVYAVRDGLKSYASVTVRKLKESDEKYRLILAQYQGRQMTNIKTVTVDVSDIAHRETKTFRCELILSGNSGSVKGFLMDHGTYAPLAEAISYTDIPIFPKTVLDTVVHYQPATETLNNDGVAYKEYGVHNDSYDIDAIFYDGYKDTKVFAYVGIPKTASEHNKVPAMVLVHGGLGKAEISWVKKWNDIGVAAIAMDLYGAGPEDDASTPNGKKKHPYAGISPWGDIAFLADYENAGMYQTVISVIHAHNLLRQNEKVDRDRIGIAGISWGGVTTTTTIGVDNRFLFAAPVYGCGYLDQCKTGFGSSYDSVEKTIHWDPANFAAKATMPVLYVNGDEDAHFSVNATSDSACVTQNSAISFHHALPHSQSAGDSVQQVYRYAQNMFNGKNTNIEITSSHAGNGVLTINYTKPEGTMVETATLYYITADGLAFGGGSAIGWQTATSYADNGNVISVTIPEDATYCYASLTDNYGDIISTKFMKVK